jgi:WXXGXW repeat (2 copies)
MTTAKYFSLRAGLLTASILASPLLLVLPDHANAQAVIGVAITIAPPLLPAYVQPPMPEMGYVWTPGYWAYGTMGYYWVPGAWIEPPEVGLLWTPPYWGWNNGVYAFHPGYWGRHVGFYGGVNYGYGYGGNGYDGGRWNGQHFEYNRAANNFGSVHVVNAYQSALTTVNHTNVSYTGGAGGLRSAPSAQDRQAAGDPHIQPTTAQLGHVSAATAPASVTTAHPAALAGHPAEQAARPAAQADPAQHAAVPAHPMQMRAPAVPAHPAERAARPAAPAYPAQRTAAPVQMRQPAAPARPAAHGAAAPHHENTPQNQ